ncbi:MAG: AtpZ/AtpI family protein [Rhodobacteraceae bacterium]|nr:AtpZ/AtpI family protein [Paracoccaceae bacterium]
MAEEPDQECLDALAKRIAAAKKVAEEPRRGSQKQDYSQAQLAWRMVIELVAGFVIGFGIGYGMDTLLGTTPVFLVLFMVAGLAAGVKTMLRSAQEVREQTAATAAKKEED